MPPTGGSPTRSRPSYASLTTSRRKNQCKPWGGNVKLPHPDVAHSHGACIMTTTAVTIAAGPILAIDLGKYKCVACVYRSATDHTYQAIDTSRADVARLIGRTRPATVVIEACSLAGWVHDLCVELRVPCRVAHTGA